MFLSAFDCVCVCLSAQQLKNIKSINTKLITFSLNFDENWMRI